MISKEELRKYAKVTGLNLGQAEKDYFQNVLLFIIYQFHSTGIIFKGGTALKKCFGINRFSEDLDFTCMEKFNVEELKKGMERFKIDFSMETKKYDNGAKITLKIKGPLYTGISQSLCKFVIYLSFRENVILPPVMKTIGRFLEEIPEFDVLVMQENEIVAEKIRAVMSRNKARDLYDLWFLLNKGAEIDASVIVEKFKYYSQKWSIMEFEKSIEEKRKIWTEITSLVKTHPSFDEVKRLVMKEAKKWKIKTA